MPLSIVTLWSISSAVSNFFWYAAKRIPMLPVIVSFMLSATTRPLLSSISKRLGCFSSAKIIASLSPRSKPVALCKRDTLSAESSEWTSKKGQFLKYSASSGYSVLRVSSSNTAKGIWTELYSLFKTSIRPILNRVNNGVVSETTIT